MNSVNKSYTAIGSKNGTRRQSVRVRLPIKVRHVPQGVRFLCTRSTVTNTYNFIEKDAFIDPFEDDDLFTDKVDNVEKLWRKDLCGKLRDPCELLMKRHGGGKKKIRVKNAGYRLKLEMI